MPAWFSSNRQPAREMSHPEGGKTSTHYNLSSVHIMKYHDLGLENAHVSVSSNVEDLCHCFVMDIFLFRFVMLYHVHLCSPTQLPQQSPFWNTSLCVRCCYHSDFMAYTDYTNNQSEKLPSHNSHCKVVLSDLLNSTSAVQHSKANSSSTWNKKYHLCQVQFFSTCN